jgi:Right handed beta helix region
MTLKGEDAMKTSIASAQKTKVDGIMGVSKTNYVALCTALRKCLFLLALAVLVPAISHAQLVVDCTGTTPGAFPSINAALPSAGAGTAIFVVGGPCNESLQLAGWTDLFIGTYNGYPNVALNGSISVSDSHGVYFHGLNITSATGDGINVVQSQALIIDSCTSSGNAGNGLDLGNASEVLVIAPASFDGNSASGIYLYGNSYVQLNSWNGQSVDISNNHNVGVWASQASFTTFGRTNIANNWGVGMQLYGGARFQMGTLTGPNTLTGNQQGGVSVQENSEISFFNFGSQTYIQNNGPMGVSAGFGGQVTLYGGVDISGHTGPALDVSANSQANVFGANSLHNNGVAGDPRSAAIRLDGNSELFLRGGSIVQNIGPAILALVNSSADLTGVAFTSNSGGIVACDSSSYLVSDLVAGSSTAPGVACRTPHALGNRSFRRAQPAPPDFSGLKARQAKMMARATKK